MGDEERVIIRPAIDALRARARRVGPLPPELFTPRARPTYDAAICMYHDQALIPLKALDIDGGVNVTLGSTSCARRPTTAPRWTSPARTRASGQPDRSAPDGGRDRGTTRRLTSAALPAAPDTINPVHAAEIGRIASFAAIVRTSP